MTNYFEGFEELLNVMPEQIRRRIYLAGERAEKRITEIGTEAYASEIAAKKNAILLNEMQQANARHARKMLEASGLGKRFFNRTFSSFETNDNNAAAYKACRAFVLGHLNGVLLAGKNGIGKTHLQAAVVNELTTQGRYVRFGSVLDLMDRYGDKVTECDLICIDDLGQEYAVGYKQDESRVYLYKLINKLYEDERGIFITTNLSSKEMSIKYGSAVLSRLQEMCEFIKFDDYDHRAVG